MTFLTPGDFPNHTIVHESSSDTATTMFDLRCRSGQFYGLVTYTFEPGQEVGSIEELIAKFARVEDANDFMHDERARLNLLGETTTLNVSADETVSLIYSAYPPEDGTENRVNALVTIRDSIFIIRITMGLPTMGDDLKIRTIEKYVSRAIKYVQPLKVAR